MLEIGIFVGLLGSMGFYMIKSSDLSKDLKEKRQAHMAEYNMIQNKTKQFQISLAPLSSAKKKHISKNEMASTIEKNNLNKFANNEENLNHLKNVLTTKIDAITLEITSLEQDIKINNEKNSEIQKLIGKRLTELERLQIELSKIA